MRQSSWTKTMSMLGLGLLPLVLSAQTQVRSTRLAVSGRPGDAAVVQVGGRSYVDVEALARITGGTLAFQGTQVVLTMPGQPPAAQAGTSAGQAAPATAAVRGTTVLTREFVTAAVSAVSAMREWRVALAYAVQHNQPVSDDLTAPYRRTCETQVALAAAAARSDQDRNAVTLLQNQLGNLRTLSGNYVGVHDSVTNIRTDALDTDPLNVKVQGCMQALAGMQAGGPFQDVSVCH